MKKELMRFGCVGLLGLALLIMGCSSTTGTLSRDPVGFLSISRITDNLTATVDELAPISLAPQRKPVTLQVAPGKHRIRILRDAALLVDRVVYISDQQTLEISVP
jgi:hypothetical protein